MSAQVLSHELVLQLMPPRCWHEVAIVIEDKVSQEAMKNVAHRLSASIPALGVVLEASLRDRENGDEDAFENAKAIASWAFDHCMTAWGEVSRYEAEPAEPEQFENEDWREVRLPVRP